MPNEHYLPQFKFYVSGFGTSPFGIEWMRFEKDCTMHHLIQTVPHLAFEVDDIEYELATHQLKVLTPINQPANGIRVAMIEHNGAPIELIEFKRKMFRIVVTSDPTKRQVWLNEVSRMMDKYF
jgi:hypothetical protein